MEILAWSKFARDSLRNASIVQAVLEAAHAVEEINLVRNSPPVLKFQPHFALAGLETAIVVEVAGFKGNDRVRKELESRLLEAIHGHLPMVSVMCLIRPNSVSQPRPA